MTGAASATGRGRSRASSGRSRQSREACGSGPSSSRREARRKPEQRWRRAPRRVKGLACQSTPRRRRVPGARERQGLSPPCRSQGRKRIRRGEGAEHSLGRLPRAALPRHPAGACRPDWLACTAVTHQVQAGRPQLRRVRVCPPSRPRSRKRASRSTSRNLATPRRARNRRRRASAAPRRPDCEGGATFCADRTLPHRHSPFPVKAPSVHQGSMRGEPLRAPGRTRQRWWGAARSGSLQPSDLRPADRRRALPDLTDRGAPDE